MKGMNIHKTKMDGLLLVEPKIFGDERGYFFESFSERDFAKETGLDVHFVQDNESMSSKGVLRGMHFQKTPHAQGKLIRVVSGRVQDVVVDMRKNSATFGRYFSVILDSVKKNMLYVPEGFAHGFLTLEDNTIFQYKCTDFYEPSSEGSVLWNDPEIGIEWILPETEYIISAKDKVAPLFKKAYRF